MKELLESGKTWQKQEKTGRNRKELVEIGMNWQNQERPGRNRKELVETSKVILKK